MSQRLRRRQSTIIPMGAFGSFRYLVKMTPQKRSEIISDELKKQGHNIQPQAVRLNFRVNGNRARGRVGKKTYSIYISSEKWHAGK